MLAGPLHTGWRVAVNDGCGVASAPMLDGWVDETAELELEVSLPEVVGTIALENWEVELAVKVGYPRLGPNGLFHLYKTTNDKVNPPQAMTSITHSAKFCLRICHNSHLNSTPIPAALYQHF